MGFGWCSVDYFYNVNLPSNILNQFIEPKTEKTREKEGDSAVDVRTERLQYIILDRFFLTM